MCSLYPSCAWDEKAIRRLIGDGKLAARLKGNEQRQPADSECPICFLNYAQINSTRCCQAKICTECFLQVRPQKDKSATCPFCNSSRVQVAVAQALDEQAILAREREEQRVIEAEIRSRAPRLSGDAVETTASFGDAPLSDRKPPSGPSSLTPEQATTAFGSSLEQNARVALLRARSSSVASESSSAHHPLGGGEVGDIAALAMTPEERAALEAEMKAQHSHPLAQRLQAEEEERRLQNELTYYQSQAARLRDLRARREHIAQTLRGATASGAPSPDGAATAPLPGADGLSSLRNGRDWNRIVEAFENSGNGTVQSLDDLVVLEAAIMLSMDEETRRSGHGSDGNDDPEFDAAQHASQGFPLARSRAAAAAALAASGRPIGGSAGTSATGSSGEDLTQHLQSIMRTLQNPRRGRNRDRRSRLGLLASDASLETAAMLMRGISEEEQLAMAIAASLAESSSGPPSQGAPDTVDEASEDDEEGEGDSAAANSTEGSANRAPPSIVWQGESQDVPGVSDVPLSAYRGYVRNISGDFAESHHVPSSSTSPSAATADDPKGSQHRDSLRLTLAVAAPAHQSAAVDSISQGASEDAPSPQNSTVENSRSSSPNPNTLDSVEAPNPT